MWLLILFIIIAIITIILFTVIEYRGFFPVSTLDYSLWVAFIIFGIITVIMVIILVIKYLILSGKPRSNSSPVRRFRATTYDREI